MSIEIGTKYPKDPIESNEPTFGIFKLPNLFADLFKTKASLIN